MFSKIIKDAEFEKYIKEDAPFGRQEYELYDDEEERFEYIIYKEYAFMLLKTMEQIEQAEC